MLGVTALLAGLGLAAVVAPGGRVRAEDKPDAKAAEAAEYVDDMATINGLIDYARRKKEPTAMLVAAQMLLSSLKAEPEEAKVEGAGKGEVPDVRTQVKDLLKEAAGMPTGQSAAAKALATEVETRLSDKPRGTPTGGTQWQGVADPTNKKTDKPIVVLNRRFLRGQIAKVSVTKLLNVGVPLDIRIYDPSGAQIQQLVGNAPSYSWMPKTEGNYKIEIRNYHTVGVGVRVTTN
jgi:hypothetical protein